MADLRDMRLCLFVACFMGLNMSFLQAQSSSPSMEAATDAPSGHAAQVLPAFADADWSVPDSIDNVHVDPVFSGQDASIYAIGVRRVVPLHRHRRHTETIMVLEGEGWMRMGVDSIFLQPGHLVVVPRMMVHGVRTTSEVPLRVWSIQAPEFTGKDREWVRP